MKPLNIFDHDDYRTLLRAWIKIQPRQGWGMIGKLAAHLRVSSVQMSQILAGTRDLTIEQAQSVGAFLRLTPLEIDYFIQLVMAERAGTAELKAYCLEKTAEIRAKALRVKEHLPPMGELSGADKSRFYSSWIYSAVRLFCSIGDGKTAKEICARFSLTKDKIEPVLAFLVDAGLCERVGERYRMRTQRTFVERGSPEFQSHLTNWRLKTVQDAADFTENEMTFTSPVSISEEDFKAFRERLLQLVREFSEQVRESPAEEVACLNIDWFKVRA